MLSGVKASIASKAELAVVENCSGEQVFATVFWFFTLLCSNRWFQDFAFCAFNWSTHLIGSCDVAELCGHVLLLLHGRTGITVQRLQVSLTSECNDA